MPDRTTYRKELWALLRGFKTTVGASAENTDVTLTEWLELRKAQAIVQGLAHQQWQRDTFASNTHPERIEA